MRLREAINTYFPGLSIIACGAALLALGHVAWEWSAFFFVGGAGSTAARLYLKHRKRNA